MRFVNDPTTRTDDIGYLLSAFFPYALLGTAIALFSVAAFAPITNKDTTNALNQAGTLIVGGILGLATPGSIGRRRPEDTEPPIDGPPSGAFPAQDPDQ